MVNNRVCGIFEHPFYLLCPELLTDINVLIANLSNKALLRVGTDLKLGL